MTTQYYRGANGILLVYDVTNEASLNSIKEKWFQTILKNIDSNAVFFMIGNKIDDQENRKISTSYGKMVAGQLNIHHAEVSAIEDNGEIDETFLKLTDLMLSQQQAVDTMQISQIQTEAVHLIMNDKNSENNQEESYNCLFCFNTQGG